MAGGTASAPAVTRAPWSSRRALCSAIDARWGCCSLDRASPRSPTRSIRSEEHTSELQSQSNLVCRLLLEKKKTIMRFHYLDADPERRRRLARTATETLLAFTTVAAALIAILASPVSLALLGTEQPDDVRS